MTRVLNGYWIFIGFKVQLATQSYNIDAIFLFEDDQFIGFHLFFEPGDRYFVINSKWVQLRQLLMGILIDFFPFFEGLHNFVVPNQHEFFYSCFYIEEILFFFLVERRLKMPLSFFILQLFEGLIGFVVTEQTFVGIFKNEIIDTEE